MGGWRNFLDSLDTNGGHIFVLMMLIAFGIVVFHYDATAGGQIVTGALGALYMMLKATGTNSEQIARAGAPYQPPQPPPAALTPAVVVADAPLPASALADTPPPVAVPPPPSVVNVTALAAQR